MLLKIKFLDNYIFILLCMFLTSSFDIFLNLKISNFNIRICYLFALALIILKSNLIILKFIEAFRIAGFKELIIWSLFLFVFIINTNYIPRNIGYFLWHLIHITFIILFVIIIESESQLKKVFDLYLLSFTIIAILGLIQFCLGIVGFDFYIEQWWLGRIPRINLFSYEPSYYGTYLIIGWLMQFYLLLDSNWTKYKIQISIVSLSLIMSSSRMSIILMFVVLAVYSFYIVLKSFYFLKAKKNDFYFSLLIGIIFALSCLLVVKYFDQIQFLFAGLSISEKFSFAGGSSHSSESRIISMLETWKVFQQSPWFGRSLGGVANQIALNAGVSVTSNGMAKQYEGMNVFLEILAASGIIGFYFFVVFLFKIIVPVFNKNASQKFENKKLVALSFSLLGVLVILALNQNISRTFLWIHIALLMSANFINLKTREI